MKMLLTAAVATMMLALAQGCKVNPATGRTQFNYMSLDQQIALGAEAAPQLTQEYGGQVESRELRDYVTQIGSRMARKVEGPYRELAWEFIVLDSAVINAFALPGGKVFVSEGLLAYMENEAQLAAVLGHEIGHVTAEHGGERMSQAMGLGIGASTIGYVLGDSSTADLTQLVVGGVGQGFLLKFSRDQESEADWLGMRYMTNVGYDPTGMLQLIQILIDVSQGPRPPEFLATHPDPQNRYDDATELLASDYAHTQNSRRFDLHRERFQRRAQPHLPPPAAAAAGVPLHYLAGGWCSHCAANRGFQPVTGR